MDLKLECKVIQKLPLLEGVSKAGNNWKKQEYIVETFGDFPKKVKVTFFGQKADNNNLEVGNDYVLYIDIESREYQGRWYTDVNGYRNEPYTGNGAAPTNNGPFTAPQQAPAFDAGAAYSQPAAPAFDAQQQGFPAPGNADDLPF